MLRREGESKQPTFADQAKSARAVPEDHVLMRMKRAVDWNAAESALARCDPSAQGRPSWPPAVLVRMLVLEQYADLSDRQAHEEALCLERMLTEKFLAAVADIKEERVRERARLLEAMLKSEDRPVSFDDPDARWGHQGPDKPFLGYKSHEAMGPDSRLITGVDVVPGNANEAVRTDELLEQDTAKREEGAAIIADALYNNATTVGQVKAASGRPCFSGLHAERVWDGFVYDEAADRMVCAEGKRSIGKSRMAAKGDLGHGDLYYVSMRDCATCPRRETCLTKGEREGTALPRRRVYLSDVRTQKMAAGQAGRHGRREQMRVRYRIEANFDEQMNRHGLRHARYWGWPR